MLLKAEKKLLAIVTMKLHCAENNSPTDNKKHKMIQKPYPEKMHNHFILTADMDSAEIYSFQKCSAQDHSAKLQLAFLDHTL